MTQVLTDGPLGLEATHRILVPDQTVGILLNDRSHAATSEIRFDRMPGFRSQPEADDNTSTRGVREGTWQWPSVKRGKTWSVEGRLIAPTLQKLRQLDQSIHRVAGFCRSTEAWWQIEPHATYGLTENFWINRIRWLAYDPDEEFTQDDRHPLGPYVLGFTAGFRAGDARWIWNDLQDESGVDDVTVTNEGAAPAEPTIRVTVDGTSGSVSVTLDNGRALVINGYTDLTGLGAGIVAFDFQLRLVTFLPAGGTIPDDLLDISHFIAWDDTNWWDAGVDGLPVGESTIVQDGGTAIQIWFYHTTY